MTHNRINYLELFHSHGYRVTRQRLAILEALCEVNGHATIGEIFNRVRTLDAEIDRSTIYRAMDVFVKLGLVNSGENFNGERVFELIKEEHHHHLICKVCGDEMEIENQVIEDFYHQLGERYPYEVKMDHLIIFGTCVGCQMKN